MKSLDQTLAHFSKVSGLVLFFLLWLPQANAEDGAAMYAEQCASCHGAQGLGNAATFSPRLAGQNTAYLREQLVAFQQGQRGAHKNDAQGQIMRVSARDLSPEQLDTLSEYLAAFPDSEVETFQQPNQLSGTTAGASLYAGHCAICHGQYGQGAESIYVPNLRILSMWYMDAQLRAYQKGWRGGTSASTRAKNMRSIGGQLPDLKQRTEITAHIAEAR